MKPATVIVLVLLALAGAFAAFNQTLMFERRVVQLPWEAVEVPLVLTLLVVTAAAFLLLLILTGLDVEMQGRARRRLESALASRDQEILTLKARAYDEVFQRIEALRGELAVRDAAGEERVVAAS
ncbi:MAG: hypothetical protein ACT4PY_13610 [Armatimonadota bacterium]